MKEIKQETNRPKGNLPYQDVNRPFRMQFVVPGPGITIEQDKNGVLYISAQGGSSVSDIIAGDNIEIERREDGGVVISAVNSVANISAGENVTITVDPVTGASVINSIIGGETNEHYKGVFDTTEDLIAADPDPEIGDYGLIKSLTITNGETSWSGQYKYCFFINGAWTVVDQMLTFTKNLDLLQQYYSVGGSSPVIYLHEIARSGNFWDLNNIPIVATPEVTVEGTTVTATCATGGAEIWYSTDGSMPHVNGTKYTGPITVSEATSFRFVAIKNGMINSLEAVASADYELQAPVIELDWHTGKITMTNPNIDGSGNPLGIIYYIRNDSPARQYTDPLNEFRYNGISLHYSAYVSNGDEQSEMTSVDFHFCSIKGSTYSNSATGAISFFYSVSESPSSNVEAADGEVHYTLDGSSPTYNSQLMTSLLSCMRYGSPVNFKCCFYRPGYIPIGVRSETFGYSSPSAPSISYNSETGLVTLERAGNLMESPIVPLETTLDDPDIGCRIYYTLDGSTPTAHSTLYTGPFQVSGNVTVKAVLVAYGQYYSDVDTLDIVQFNEPEFMLDSNTGTVSLSNPNGSGTIYYTTDGSTPTYESSQYSSPFVLTSDTTVKAVVIAETGKSPVAEKTYTKASAPTFPVPDQYPSQYINLLTGEQRVIISTNQNGGVTCYSFATGDSLADDPTIESTKYSDPIIVSYYDGNHFKARTWCEGFLPSSVVGNSYGLNTIHPVLISYDSDSGTVNFTRQWMTAYIPLQTNNNTPELGCRVYYTLDGSTPDDKSTLWDGNPVSVAPGTTVKALLVCYGQYESEVSTLKVPGGVEYLYFEAAQANSTVSMVSTLETAPDLEYSTDGVTWQEWQHTTADSFHTFDTITLGAVDDKVYFRGDNPTGLGYVDKSFKSSIFYLTGAINAGGNVMSLLDKTMELTEVPAGGLFELFYCDEAESALLTPPGMSTITSIGEFGCDCMYYGCTSLTFAVSMPSLTTIGEEGCHDMYNNCTFNMSDDRSTLNFAFPTPPVTAGETTYQNAYDIAAWMGNTNGF